GRFSPDGTLLAFNSNRSGQFQVYVKPITAFTGASVVPATATAAPPAAQVSQGGAIGGIVWRKDGRELFYLAFPSQGVVAVGVSTAPPFQPAAPGRLFHLHFGLTAPAQLSAVSSPNGQRFVFAVNVHPRR